MNGNSLFLLKIAGIPCDLANKLSGVLDQTLELKNDWRQFGIQLGLELDEIENIERATATDPSQHKNSPTLLVLLASFGKGSCHATVENALRAVRSLNPRRSDAEACFDALYM